MKYDNQLRYAVNIIKEYDGRYPLAAWLKDFFRLNKQMGSTDRKTVSELVYGYFRLGHNQFKNTEERLLAGLYSGKHLPEIAAYFKPAHPLPAEILPAKIFPWRHLLSDGIDAEAFASSFLVQPDLFIRMRPGRDNQVIDKLKSSGIQYALCGNSCIALPNSTKVSSILQIDHEAVVQDKSSQQTGLFLQNISFHRVWDCCAASGGKSIMAYDLDNTIDLTVSDIRESIIINLKTRLKEAGINNYHAFIANLSLPKVKLPDRQYDLVIADVPCSGSGTWSRTPEQLYFFREEKIAHYTKLQQQIVSAAITKLVPGGHLLYITCSVFKQENEDMVTYLSNEKNLNLVKMEIIKGYREKADTMFAALFTNGPASE